jgi:hypothetical protein
MAEYSLRGLSNPIAIAEHRVSRLLPSTEQLELELEQVVKELDDDEEL